MTEAIIVAVVVNTCATIAIGIKEYFRYKAKKSGNNPHPCKDHADSLKELDDKLDKLGQRVSRIEGMLNGTYKK